jgi:hypothetical protein
VQLQRLVRPTLLAYQSASSREEKDRWLGEFLDVPKRHLTRPSRLSTSAARQSLDAQLSGAAARVEAVMEADRRQEAEDELRRRRAMSQARAGYFGRAARTLANVAVKLELTAAAIMQELRRLHPQGSPPTPLGDSAPPFLPTWEVGDLQQVLHRSSCGAAGGPSGWTEELLAVVAKDALLAEVLVAITEDIATNSVGVTVRQRLTASNLSPIAKDATSLRPIAVGETLVKLTGSLMLLRRQAEIDAFFGPLQFGCGARGGSENIVHALRHEWTKCEGRNVHLGILTIDGRNAFNVPTRQAVADALANSPFAGDFARLYDFDYGSPSLLLTHIGEVVTSERGVRQGKPEIVGYLVSHSR